MATIASKYKALSGRLDEATLRLWVAVEARQLGRGGVSTVAKAVGISRTTIYAGLAELDSTAPEPVVKAGSRQRVTAIKLRCIMLIHNDKVIAHGRPLQIVCNTLKNNAFFAACENQAKPWQRTFCGAGFGPSVPSKGW